MANFDRKSPDPSFRRDPGTGDLTETPFSVRRRTAAFCGFREPRVVVERTLYRREPADGGDERLVARAVLFTVEGKGFVCDFREWEREPRIDRKESGR